MPSTLIHRGASWLGERLQTAAGMVGTYRQDHRTSAAITATVTEQMYEVTDAEGMTTSMLSHDWTFTAAELVIEGNQVTPRPRDTWKPTINGNLETYEVLPLGNRPCFERMDTSGILIVVHTKRVA